MKKLPVKGPKDIAKLPPEKEQRIEKVPEGKPFHPDASTSIWAEILLWLRGWVKTKARDASEGKDVSFPSLGGIVGLFSGPGIWVAIATLVLIVGLVRTC